MEKFSIISAMLIIVLLSFVQSIAFASTDIEVTDFRFVRLSTTGNESSLKAQVTLSNLSVSEEKATVIIAEYNSDGVLAEIKLKTDLIPAGKTDAVIETDAICVAKPFPQNDIKAFVLADLSELIPLGSAKEYLQGFVSKPDISPIADSGDISPYTTTRYEDGVVNLHLTSPEQAGAKQKGSEGGQLMYAAAISDANPNRILIGSDCQLIYRSEDGGKSFVPSAEGINTYGIDYLEFYPGNADIAFAMTSLHSVSTPTKVNNNVGIYKSTDGGKTWSRKCIAKYYRRYSVRLMVFGDKLNENGYYPIYAATHGSGVLRSDDCGETWQCIGLEDKTIYNIEKQDNVIAVSCGSDGIYTTVNEGAEWTQTVVVSAADSTANAIIRGIAINPADTNHRLVCDSDYIYESTDGGVTFAKSAYRWGEAGLWVGGLAALTYGAVNPTTGAARLYLMCNTTSVPLRYSDNNGKKFYQPQRNAVLSFKTNDTGYYNEGFAIDKSNPDRLFSPVYGISVNGGKSFEKIAMSGVSGTRASDFLFDENNPSDIIIASIDNGVIRSAPVGDEWYPAFTYAPMEGKGIPNPLTSYCAARDPKNNDRILVTFGGWSGAQTLYESLDNGLNYSPVQVDGANFKAEFSGDGLFFHPQKPDIIYFANYKSTDDGKTWTQLDRKICAVAPSDGDIVYSKGSSYIYVSKDTGITWAKLNENCKLSGMQLITVDSQNPLKVYVGLYQTGFCVVEDDNCEYITKSNGLAVSAMGNAAVFSVAQDPQNPLHLVAGGCDNLNAMPKEGISESYDGGKTWKVIPVPPPCDVWKVEFHPTRPQVFIATSGGTYVYEYSK